MLLRPAAFAAAIRWCLLGPRPAAGPPSASAAVCVRAAAGGSRARSASAPLEAGRARGLRSAFLAGELPASAASGALGRPASSLRGLASPARASDDGSAPPAKPSRGAPVRSRSAGRPPRPARRRQVEADENAESERQFLSRRPKPRRPSDPAKDSTRALGDLVESIAKDVRHARAGVEEAGGQQRRPQLRAGIPPQELERLQKVIARAGLASRRAAEQLIADGRVRVNGERVTELGTKVGAGDSVVVDGREIRVGEEAPAASYVLVYKPRGHVSTVQDDRGRPTVLEAVPGARERRLVPVGRLDAESEGLMLLTSDYALVNVLTHPRFEHEKEYLVEVDARLAPDELRSLREGVSWIDEDAGKVVTSLPCSVEVAASGPNGRRASQRGAAWLRFVLREGKKRQIRRMVDAVGRRVLSLVRVRIAGLELGRLAPGEHRELSPAEADALRASTEAAPPRPSPSPSARPAPRPRAQK
eukprot:tig00000241_g20938.t1